MASIDLALSLAARGWAVFPVGKNKRPIIGEWTTRATTDEARLRDLFAGYPSCAVGIACGRASGLFVVDVDGNGEHPIHDRLDPTLVVGTPSGGFHYYYAMPDDVSDDDVLRNTQKAEACLGYPDVDTRGIGGYVVAPGSVTAGGTYEILSDVPPAPIPTWIVDAMRAYKRAKAAPQVQQRVSLPMVWRDASVAQERARRYAERMPGSVSGQGGHVAAMKVARALVTGFGLDEAAAGIHEVANQEMVRALRVITVERGIDPRGFDLLPFGAEAVSRLEPVFEEMPGWSGTTAGVRDWDALPLNARRYLERLAQAVGAPIDIVSTGPDRDETILLRHPFA